MKKNKEMFRRQTYTWTELGKGSNMVIKVGVNDKGVRVVSAVGAFEIPLEYSAAGKIMEMLGEVREERKKSNIDGAVKEGREASLLNEVSFMMNVLQHFSDETVRTMLFTILDLYYFLIVNQTEYSEVADLKASVEAIDRSKDMQGYLDQQLKMVEFYQKVREKALLPFENIYSLMKKIKEDRLAEIKAAQDKGELDAVEAQTGKVVEILDKGMSVDEVTEIQ